jgi:hypothetical protein
MPKALISSNEVVQHISGWKTVLTEEPGVELTNPIYTDIPNSNRIAEIEENTFEVNSALFWVDCNSSVTTDSYYYDSSDSTIKIIVNEPEPS